mgnify:CR=1 FL=1
MAKTVEEKILKLLQTYFKDKADSVSTDNRALRYSFGVQLSCILKTRLKVASEEKPDSMC